MLESSVFTAENHCEKCFCVEHMRDSSMFLKKMCLFLFSEVPQRLSDMLMNEENNVSFSVSNNVAPA